MLNLSFLKSAKPKQITEYNDHVVESILANDQFGITIVSDLESLRSIYFVKDEYISIEKLIQKHDIEAIKSLTQNGVVGEEYLEIMLFKDQNEKPYIVTVYDSNGLEQDPQVIEIYQRNT